MKRPRSVGVHDGTFHADEVVAIALLILFDLVDEEGIVRTRDPDQLALCEYICDVGGVYNPSEKLFDHHQAEYEGELSSSGMVLLYLKEQKLISKEMYTFLNNALILGVDAHDTGRSSLEIGYCSFSIIIANYNPITDLSQEALNKAFFDALHFTIGHLERVIARYNYNVECRKIVKKEMEKHKICLMFDRPIPWLESFFALGGENHPALFVLMPAGTHWKLRGIPPDYMHRMQVRLPLPESWAGLLGGELKQASSIPGAVFCHKGRFISVWETRENALQALKSVLNRHRISYENDF
ncbi:MAG: MYG1 family protein [Chlamydiales bacterium]